MEHLAHAINSFQQVAGNGQRQEYPDSQRNNEVITTDSALLSARHGMQTWDENQLAAWTMFGAASVTLGFFWLQHYYYKFWYGSKAQYAVTANDDDLIRMNTYTMWGLSENVNAIFMLAQWVPTAIVWVLTAGTNDDGVIWFFVVWCGIMHYVDMVRFVVINIIKLVSLFYDTDMMTNSFNGLQKNYKVSKDHELQYWDFAMEWFGFLVSYSLYLDLHTIIEDQDYRVKVREQREKEIYDSVQADPEKTDDQRQF